MGNPDLSPPQDESLRGLVIFPADAVGPAQRRGANEWWLVVAALAVTAAMIAIAFAVR